MNTFIWFSADWNFWFCNFLVLRTRTHYGEQVSWSSDQHHEMVCRQICASQKPFSHWELSGNSWKCICFTEVLIDLGTFAVPRYLCYAIHMLSVIIEITSGTNWSSNPTFFFQEIISLDWTEIIQTRIIMHARREFVFYGASTAKVISGRMQFIINHSV